MNIFQNKTKRMVSAEIHPEEIFLDSHNLPGLDGSQFEGRIVQPIRKRAIGGLGIFFLFVAVVFGARLFSLQVVQGEEYAVLSSQNHLAHSIIFSERGVIYDRNGVKLAWNVPRDGEVFADRKYIDIVGLSHILGYIALPKKDTSGIYFDVNTSGLSGVERVYDEMLRGTNGLKIVETDALGKLQSESVITETLDGDSVTLSVDVKVTSALHKAIAGLAKEADFDGGAGVILDIHTGEILALTSYPEFNSETVSAGGDEDKINAYIEDSRKPFLNRVISGLYAPGSVVKPFLALGALAEGIITPEKEIFSSGSITIENPYNPDKPTVIRDWRAHGWTDMRRAIAVSSDVYFYTIGGGYEGQKGLGIRNIEKYSRLFGLGEATGLFIAPEDVGTIPNPEWKQRIFNDDWRLGDTYNTAIGQYGFQVTPLQIARAVAAIANDGTVLVPTIIASSIPISDTMELPEKYFTVIKDGMRLAVTEGTAQGLSYSRFHIAAKTGTAEVGKKKEFINSWVVGFFPYESPKYAFAILMDRGNAGTLTGGVLAGRRFFDEALSVSPEYFELLPQ
jgi:penicillin-binding protein 2